MRLHVNKSLVILYSILSIKGTCVSLTSHFYTMLYTSCHILNNVSPNWNAGLHFTHKWLNNYPAFLLRESVYGYTEINGSPAEIFQFVLFNWKHWNVTCEFRSPIFCLLKSPFETVKKNARWLSMGNCIITYVMWQQRCLVRSQLRITTMSTPL